MLQVFLLCFIQVTGEVKQMSKVIDCKFQNVCRQSNYMCFNLIILLCEMQRTRITFITSEILSSKLDLAKHVHNFDEIYKSVVTEIFGLECLCIIYFSLAEIHPQCNT